MGVTPSWSRSAVLAGVVGSPCRRRSAVAIDPTRARSTATRACGGSCASASTADTRRGFLVTAAFVDRRSSSHSCVGVAARHGRRRLRAGRARRRGGRVGLGPRHARRPSTCSRSFTDLGGTPVVMAALRHDGDRRLPPPPRRSRSRPARRRRHRSARPRQPHQGHRRPRPPRRAAARARARARRSRRATRARPRRAGPRWRSCSATTSAG